MRSSKIQKQVVSTGEKFKLQINSRTIVIVKTKEALKVWMTRHPEAKIID